MTRFHRLLVTANFVVEFLKNHPFADCNGRLSRVLSNLLLLRTGSYLTDPNGSTMDKFDSTSLLEGNGKKAGPVYTLAK